MTGACPHQSTILGQRIKSQQTEETCHSYNIGNPYTLKQHINLGKNPTLICSKSNRAN